MPKRMRNTRSSLGAWLPIIRIVVSRRSERTASCHGCTAFSSLISSPSFCDAYAGAFNVIYAIIEEALKATGVVQGESTLMASNPVEIERTADTELPALQRMGCAVEIVS